MRFICCRRENSGTSGSGFINADVWIDLIEPNFDAASTRATFWQQARQRVAMIGVISMKLKDTAANRYNGKVIGWLENLSVKHLAQKRN